MKTLVLFLLLFSCGQKSKLHFEVVDPPVSAALKESISYDQLYNEVLVNKCMGCHDEGGKTKLGTYADAKAHLAGIKKTVINLKTLPKTPIAPITKNERQLFKAWIEAGAPEQSRDGSHSEMPIHAELRPTYASIKTNIIDLKCIGCHSVGGRAAKYLMKTKEQLLNPELKMVIAEIHRIVFF